MNQIKILFFATLRDRAGLKSMDMQIPLQTTVAEFKHILTERLPGLKGLLGHSLIAVNSEYVFDAALIPPDAEVALFPPVSGG
jgi:molybdopterin converting factor subunit 1